jgi:hypothetical protein
MTYFSKLINQRKSLVVFGLAAIGLISAPSSASAFTLVNTPGFNDAAFEQLRTDGKFTELFVAEGRMGDNKATSGNHEIDILGDTKKNFNPIVKADRVWENGGLVDFSLKYDGSQVTYKVDGQTLSTQLLGSATDIFLRTFAQKDGSGSLLNKNNKIELSNLLFYENGSTTGNPLSTLTSSGTATSSDADYLQISNISSKFELTGKVSLSWKDAAPKNSNLAFQIKVGNSPTSVPEPGMVSAIAIASVASIAYKRRKKASLT